MERLLKKYPQNHSLNKVFGYPFKIARKNLLHLFEGLEKRLQK